MIWKLPPPTSLLFFIFFEHVCSILDVPLDDGAVDEFTEFLVPGVLQLKRLVCVT